MVLDDAHFFIPSVQQPEEQAGFLSGHRQITYFVQDQHAGITHLLQLTHQSLFTLPPKWLKARASDS